MTETSIALLPGDNREWLKMLADTGQLVDSVVCDPPYGLVSVQKRFAKPGSAGARTEGNDGSFARLSGGFMGKAWDGSGIERDPEFWKLVLDVMKPGAYCFAFSGSRTGHWQACAMEIAGFIMHPMHGWVFGSGLPKAHNASKAIDRSLGAERDRVPVKQTPGWQRGVGNTRPYMSDPDHTTVSDTPATPEAAQWSGYAYGTQAQKPALEPIYLGQKPFSEKTGAANILKHGVGAVNIDDCRVPSEAGRPLVVSNRRSGNNTYSDGLQGSKAVVGGTDTGRHPSNLLLDGSPEVVALFPQSKGQQGDVRGCEPSAKTSNTYGEFSERAVSAKRNDSGSAARFFHHFPLTEEDYDMAIAAGVISDPSDIPATFYHPKAGKADRAGSRHPTVKPVALMQYLIRHVTPPGGVVLDPFAGSGTTGEAARREGFDCILMEQEPEYVEFLKERFGIA